MMLAGRYYNITGLHTYLVCELQAVWQWQHCMHGSSIRWAELYQLTTHCATLVRRDEPA